LSRRGLIILVVAVLVMGSAAAVIASSVGGGDSSKAQEVHTLPDGGVHTGPMPTGTHTMEGGESMGDEQGMGGMGSK